MKRIMIILQLVACVSFAQNVGVKDISASEDTTIEIKKGKRDQEFEVVSGESEIEGDPAPLLNDARTNWKKACADWKAEIKDMNKENQVLGLNCGKMKCSTVAMESSCQSQGTYKIKTRVR